MIISYIIVYIYNKRISKEKSVLKIFEFFQKFQLFFIFMKNWKNARNWDMTEDIVLITYFDILISFKRYFMIFRLIFGAFQFQYHRKLFSWFRSYERKVRALYDAAMKYCWACIRQERVIGKIKKAVFYCDANGRQCESWTHHVKAWICCVTP